MGNKLEDFQFQVISNPFGIVFNPISFLQNLSICLSPSSFDTSEVIERNGSFFHYQFHSKITGASKEELTERITEIQQQISLFLRSADYLILTLGTAWVYQLRSTNRQVANCHKMPSELFDKKMLTVSEIVHSCDEFLKLLWKINPTCRVLLSVSPVRHLKDSLPLNNVSKSVLRVACHEIVTNHSENVRYFPAFEIMTDDLRDYRFYKEDMIHPNSQAEEYVWNKFGETFFSSRTIELNKEIAELKSAIQHRAFRPESVEHQLFLKKIVEKSKKLNALVPIPRLIKELELKLKA
jgi:hypothetical protein